MGIIESICKSKLETEQQMTKVYDDMIDYYTTWVHQIKTPIASMRLRLKQEDTSFSRKLSSDLLHIEQYVEMVLTYLRMESDTTDYVFREAELDKILKDNIRRLRGDFIMKTTKNKLPLFFNILIIIFEIIGCSMCAKHGLSVLQYYTVLSNIFALITSSL